MWIRCESISTALQWVRACWEQRRGTRLRWAMISTRSVRASLSFTPQTDRQFAGTLIIRQCPGIAQSGSTALLAELIKDSATESDELIRSHKPCELGLETPVVVHVVACPAAKTHVEIGRTETGFCCHSPNGL